MHFIPVFDRIFPFDLHWHPSPTRVFSMEKVVRKWKLNDPDAVRDDVAYWMSKSPAERIAAVNFLREQYYGPSIRFQSVACVVQRKRR